MTEQSNQQAESTGENSIDSISEISEKLQKLEENYKNLQADYTRKSQKLKELESSSSYNDDDNNTEAEQWKTRIKQNVLEPELDKIKSNFTQTKEFESILQNAPELRPFEKAISDLVKTTGKGYEDIIHEYNFLSSDKLEKAKTRSLIGDREFEKSKKSVSEMTPKEYAERKKAYTSWDIFEQSKNF